MSSPSHSCSGRSVTKSLAITSRDDGERFDRLEHVGDQLVVVETGTDAVGALLERHEAHREAVGRVAHEHAEVREAAHEERVAGAPQLVVVVRRVRDLGDRDDERRRGLAPVRLGCIRVDHMEHDVGVGTRRLRCRS